MAFFTAKTDAASVADSSGGSYITTSGIYDVVLKYVSVKQNEKGARSIDFNVEYNGTPHTFYGLKLEDNEMNKHYQADIFNKLMIVTGNESIENPETITVPLGKDKTLTDLKVLTEFCDVPVKMGIKYEYKIYNNEIKEDKVIRAFYSPDGFTAAELLNDIKEPKQLGKDMQYSETVKYSDGLTAEDIAAWKEGRKANARGPVTKAPTVNKFAGAAKKAPFIKSA